MSITTIINYIPESVQGRVAASVAHQQAYRAVLLEGLSLTADNQAVSQQFAEKAALAAGLSKAFGERAPEDMRPEAEEVITRFLTNQRNRDTADAESVAEAMGVSVEEAKAAVENAQKENREQEQQLKDTLEANRALVLNLLTGTPALDDDAELDQATMASVLDKVADKLDQIAQQALSRAARTNRARVQSQLAEQRREVLAAIASVDGKLDELEESRP